MWVGEWKAWQEYQQWLREAGINYSDSHLHSNETIVRSNEEGLKVRLRIALGPNTQRSGLGPGCTLSHKYLSDGGYSGMVERMLWCKPQCDSSLHLQPLRFLWSLPMRVWELGVGNESSWAIMNVLIQVCFDEIPPDWSQVTEQNSESLLTTVMKAILPDSMMESVERLWGSLQDTLLCFFPLLRLPFLQTSSVITE